MSNELKDVCKNCGKLHEKRNIDLLPTWLQCKKCGAIYCVKCAKSSIRKILIEKLMMTIIVVLFLYIGIFILEDLKTPFNTATFWGLFMTLLPVAFQLLLLKYHERNTFKENQVLKNCLECSNPLNTLYHDSILNSWLFTIYAFNILVFLFEFFFKLYNLEFTNLLLFSSNFFAILFVILLIVIIIISLIIAIFLYKFILSNFQSSYRIWILVIIFYIIGLSISMFLIQISYYISYFGIIHSDLIKSFNLIFTSLFAAIPKLFWFVPGFLMSAIIYAISKKSLMNYKLNSWIKLGLGFAIVIVPLTLWGIFNPFFYVFWDSLVSWGISNFIFNLIFGLGIFTIIEKMLKKNKSKLPALISAIGLCSLLILYLLNPTFFNLFNEFTLTLYSLIITCLLITIVLYELFTSWFDEKKYWRSKIGRNLPDATYLVIVGALCYCIALNILYLLSFSPLHILYYADVPVGTPTSINYIEILYPNTSIINFIGVFGIISAPILKLFVKKFIS
ncbi:MAG: hypothetical protein ACTSPY_09690 [Candidatus Helarchaeota archaeon]